MGGARWGSKRLREDEFGADYRERLEGSRDPHFAWHSKRARAARRLAPARVLHYRAPVHKIAGPESLVEQPIPDLSLPSSQGGEFGLRRRVGIGPLVLFFYIHNGTPG